MLSIKEGNMRIPKDEQNNIAFACQEHKDESYRKISKAVKDPNYVYVRFYDGEQSEAMWVFILAGNKNKGMGFIDNSPVLMKDVKRGDMINFEKNHQNIVYRIKDA
tara:strand:+ start:666 stop:983 length:318 start_codon:yes stop_codon:yes gene_type:complete